MSDHKPSTHHALTPFLHVEGGSAFIEFLEKGFGAELVMKHEDDDRIVHAEVDLLGTIIELSEARDEYPATRTAFHVFVEDADATCARLLEMGATALHEVQDMDYGERSGGVQDRWGNSWYVATVTSDARRNPQYD